MHICVHVPVCVCVCVCAYGCADARLHHRQDVHSTHAAAPPRLSSNPGRPRIQTQVWGGKVAELDGTPTEPRNYDAVAARTQFNWVAR